METTVNGELRVLATDAALDLIAEIKRDHPDILFHQSGGCCDGSSPMCFPAGEFATGDSDVLLGRFEISDGGPGAETGSGTMPLDFWMSREQFSYWSHTHLTVDVVPGRGSGFSVEAPEGKRFLIRSTLKDWPA